MNRRKFLIDWTAAAAGASVAGFATAQSAAWPGARAINYIVPIFPGSTADIIARVVTQRLGETLQQSFVVENRTGAGGTIAAAAVAKAAPDGYTLMSGTSGTHATNVSLYSSLPYDPVKDFEPVSLMASLANVLVVSPTLGVNSVAELIALARKDERRRSFGSAGPGTGPHLAGELFGQAAGVGLTHVAYRNNPGLTDVMSGQLTFKFDQLSAVLPLVQSGRLKVLAVTAATRLSQLPDVPTMIEAGVPGFEVVSWHAMYAPRGTPRAIVDRLSAEIARVLRSPEVRAKLGALGIDAVGGTPDELAGLMAREIPRWAEVIRRSGAKPD